MADESSKPRTYPNLDHLSRFTMAMGIILAIYVLAVGELPQEVSFSFISLKLSKPNVLLYLISVASIFSSFRYWYYGIKVPLTKTQIRKFLKSPQSLSVFKGSERKYEEYLQHSSNLQVGLNASLEERCPAGLQARHFTVFTDSMVAPTDGYMKKLVANRVDQYFPGITTDEIQLEPLDASDCAWACIGTMRPGTRLRARAEDIDLWAPVFVNAIGLGLLTIPSLWDTLKECTCRF